jgi:hypothetical protein
MPIPLDFLRGVVGLFCLFFAHFLGRSIVRLRRGQQRPRHLYGWLIRMLIAAGAILWQRGLDTIAIVIYTLSAVSLALGIFDEQRLKRHEDLTRQIFGE